MDNVDYSPFMEWFMRSTPDNDLSVRGYTRLSDNPEIRMGVERIADLISIMTIHLMENTDSGDVRIKDELSRKIDINPNSYMTRQNLISWIVRSLILNGNAYVIVKTQDGFLKDLVPIAFRKVVARQDKSYGYELYINDKKFNPDEVLHFKINPLEEKPWLGEAYSVVLRDVANNLKQSQHTINEFLSNRVLPNIIVKVDAFSEEVSSIEGREKVFDNFVRASKAGQPWIVPADLIDIDQVKPLTLNDIAIKDTIEIDKRTVAGILGIPAFLLGVGDFNADEYNNFIRTRIMAIAKAIEQELTKKILISDNRYFKFNSRSLYSYNFEEQTRIYHQLYASGIVTGNEVRDILGLSPKEELDDLIILENYIPKDKIGEQEKLKGGDE